MKESFVIDGFEKLTKQQLFDKAAHHIMSTKQKSQYGAQRTCVYTGSGCAAAPFIKPEFRDKVAGPWPPAFEAQPSGVPVTDGHGMAVCHTDFELPMHEANFIAHLQSAHDETYSDGNFMDEWKRNMKHLAYNHGLSTAALK